MGLSFNKLPLPNQLYLNYQGKLWVIEQEHCTLPSIFQAVNIVNHSQFASGCQAMKPLLVASYSRFILAVVRKPGTINKLGIVVSFCVQNLVDNVLEAVAFTFFLLINKYDLT